MCLPPWTQRGEDQHSLAGEGVGDPFRTTGKKAWHYVYSALRINSIHCKKKVTDFPVPSRDVTNKTLPGGKKFYYSPPGRLWLVTSQLGTGKSVTFFIVDRLLLYMFVTSLGIRQKTKIDRWNFTTSSILNGSQRYGLAKRGGGWHLFFPSLNTTCLSAQGE